MPNDNDRKDRNEMLPGSTPQGTSGPWNRDENRPTGRGEDIRGGGNEGSMPMRGEGSSSPSYGAEHRGETTSHEGSIGGGSEPPRKKQRRGFAAMDPAKQREIASKGGKASHAQGTGHEWDSETAREAGRKGGQASRGGRGKIRPPEGGTPGGAGA
jgi:general stress protein YciG